ncbi:hypothetical protein SDC9_58913 [bioreactor metagenome]|uniref:Ig-like domain-containing protein n=1 Tax=bioreactor metagenome TaxID=1076179 RepID=A0A644X8R6_9ZZZZ
MSVTTQDSTFNIVSWITLVSDTINDNDTATASVVSGHIPLDPVVTHDTIPYGTSATLTAVSADSVLWYIDDVIATSFHQGQSYTTPLLTDTTTYYVQASAGSGTQYVGPYDYSIGTSSSYANNTYREVFDVLNPSGVTIKTVDIFPSVAAGSAYSIVVENASSTVIASYSGITTVAATQREIVPVDFTIPAGTGYKIGFSSNPGMYRNTAGATYPYTIPNQISITGNTFSGYPAYYYFIYNWQVTDGSGCKSARVPVTAYVLPPAAEFEMAEIVSPVTGCTNGTDSVKIKFFNSGADTLDIPFDVSYQVNNTTPVTETLNYIMLPGDSMIHTFLTPISLPITSGDTSFSLKVWGDLAVDFYNINDSLQENISRGYIPPVPVAYNDTVPYGSSATLTASSTYMMNWFDTQYGGTLLDTGNTFVTPVLYGNQTYYVESQEGIVYNYTFDNDLQGWSALTPCSSYTTYNWAWDSDGGNGAVWMVNPATYSAAVLQSPVLSASGDYADLTFRHRYYTENNYDNGYVAYRLNGGAWTHLPMTSGNYNNNDNLSKDPLLGSCSTGPTFGVFAGLDSNYHTSTAQIPIAGAGNFEIAFVFSSDVSTGYDGWFIDEVNVNMTGCSSDRVPATAVVTGQPDVDAAVLSVLNPVGQIPLGTENVEVEIVNYGLDTMSSVDIAWTVNGVLQTPFAWTGSLITGEKDTVVIGTYLFDYTPYPGLNDLVVWTENPNAVADTFNANDTVAVVIDAHEPYNGTYYIQTATPDFDSFSTAALALNDWGIDGPVTILADNGTYNESFAFLPVPGASATNTVTFTSLSGVNTDVTIEFANTSTRNFVVRLDSADYITFSDMSMRSLSTATYGRIIELANGADFNHFENLILTGIDGSSSTAAVIYSGSTGAETGNVFSGNTIDQGYYAVYFYGSSANHKAGNYFVNNNITNFEYYGIYLYYNDSARVIGNNLSNIATASTNYHLYMGYVGAGSRIENNTIVGNGSGSFYGIYLYYNNSTGTIPNLIANNFVSQTGSSMGTAYGIETYYSNYLNIYNNSVNIGAGSATGGRAFYQYYGTGNVNVVNNNFVNTSGGYAYYINNTPVINVADYNNLYTNGPVLAYWGADRVDLAALQAVSSKNLHSLSITPGYYSPADLHTYQFALRAGTPLADVTTDIDGDVRDALTPTIGADEYVPQAVDAGIVKFDQPSLVTTAGANTVSVTMTNYGSNTLTSADIAWTIDGVLQTPYSWTGSIAFANEEDSIPVGTANLTWGVHHLVSWPENPNGTSDMLSLNDTAETTIVACNGPMAGTYTIGATGDFASFSDAVLYASSCGIGNAVVFEVEPGIY